MDAKRVISDYLSRMGSKGGKARARKYGQATLSKWAKLGGRPRKRRGGTK